MLTPSKTAKSNHMQSLKNSVRRYPITAPALPDTRFCKAVDCMLWIHSRRQAIVDKDDRRAQALKDLRERVLSDFREAPADAGTTQQRICEYAAELAKSYNGIEEARLFKQVLRLALEVGI